MPSASESVGDGIMFSSCPLAAFVRSFGQTLLPWYLTNGLSSLDETYREHSLVWWPD